MTGRMMEDQGMNFSGDRHPDTTDRSRVLQMLWNFVSVLVITVLLVQWPAPCVHVPELGSTVSAGQWVKYKGGKSHGGHVDLRHYPSGQIGRVKSIRGYPLITVVFNCGNDWDNFEKYIGEAAWIQDVTPIEEPINESVGD